MTLDEQLSALAGIRGNELKLAKTRVVDALEPASLGVFLRTAPPADIKKLNDLFLRDHHRLPTERALPLHEASFAPEIVARPRLDKSLAALRTSLTRTLDGPTALACLERHPGDAFLVDHLRSVGTVGELRRAAELSQPSVHVKALLTALAAAPGGIDVGSAEALVKLGCAFQPVPAGPHAYPRVHRSGHGEWSDRDPLGELEAPRGASFLVAHCVTFPMQSFPAKLRTWDTEPDPVQLGVGGSSFDVAVSGRRRILAPIGYSEGKQIYYAVDIADPTTHVQVYTIDHDGTGADAYDSWMMFAYRLQLPT